MKPNAFAIAALVAVSLPTPALAEEVFADLGGTRVPVGPEGSVVLRVERARAAGARYAVVRSREPGAPTRCGIPAERVSAWIQVDGRWVEALSEVFDRCPATPRSRSGLTVRARVVQVGDGPTEAAELHVRVLDPRLPVGSAPLTRYQRVGDRFIAGRGDGPLAAAPYAPEVTLVEAPESLDGAGWGSVAPFAQIRGAGAQRADVWLGARGSRLRFAARVEGAADGRAELTLRLSETGVSTARIRGRAGNAGRALVVRCEGEGAPRVPDARVRCTREGDAMRIEGETDLATMLWSRNDINAVAALAAVAWGGGRAVPSDPSMRLRALALPARFDVMQGASAEALAACGRGYRGRVGDATGIGSAEGIVTCGARCEDGLCERTFGTHGAATRMVWEAAPRPGEAMCMNVTGVGAGDFGACRGARGDFARLIGRIPARGFDLVVVVERTLRGDEGGERRRPEVWALVTRSARWQRLWAGEAEDASTPRVTSVSLRGQHPTLCRDAQEGARCDRVDALAFSPPTDRGVTAWISRTSARWQ